MRDSELARLRAVAEVASRELGRTSCMVLGPAEAALLAMGVAVEGGEGLGGFTVEILNGRGASPGGKK